MMKSFCLCVLSIFCALLLIGCQSVTEFKHPPFTPVQGKAYSDLYGTYRIRANEEFLKTTFFLHVGEAEKKFPKGFLDVMFVYRVNGEIRSQRSVAFVKNLKDKHRYLIGIPNFKKKEFSKQRWDRSLVRSYSLLLLEKSGNEIFLKEIKDDQIVKLVKNKVILGTIDMDHKELFEQSDELAKITITSKTEDLAKFFQGKELVKIFSGRQYKLEKID